MFDVCHDDCYMYSSLIRLIMQERDVIVLPRKPDHVSNSRTAKLTITKTLEFSSQTLRSGVVVMADDALPGSALLFIRGAPGIIKDLVQPSSVPADFEQVIIIITVVITVKITITITVTVTILLINNTNRSHYDNNDNDSNNAFQLMMS